MINSHQKAGIPLPDDLTYQELMKNNMYDNFITFKCLNCGETEEIDEDFVLSFLEHYRGQDYPEDFCKKCHGKSVPLDIYNEIKK